MIRLPILFSGDENHAHPRHTGHRWLDLILALSAIFISAVSLYVAVEHGRIERDLVAANSWPFLAVSYQGDTQHPVYQMENTGVGPAKLERIEVLYRGQVMPDLDALLERCCGLPVDPVERRKQGYPVYYRSFISRTVFRPGEALELMTVHRQDGDHGLTDRFIGSIDQISFRGCYCSVFDECWQSNFVDLQPVKVGRCPVGPSFNERRRKG